jgi:hypothetical protein
MNLEAMKNVLATAGARSKKELLDALSSAVQEIEYLQRIARAYQETAVARSGVQAPARLGLALARSASSYSVGVPKSKAIALFDLEVDDEGHSVGDLLGKIKGVSEVNYDGHFGPFVYMTIEADEDTPQTHAAVCEVIQGCLARIR